MGLGARHQMFPPLPTLEHLSHNKPVDRNQHISLFLSKISFSELMPLETRFLFQLLPAIFSHEHPTCNSSMLHASLLLLTLFPPQTSISAHNTLTHRHQQSFNKAITFYTSLSSLILCNLHPNNDFFYSLLSSSFLWTRSPHTATPATELLPPTSFLPMFS